MNKKTQPKISEIEKHVMKKIKKGEAKIKPQSYYLIVGFLSFLSVALLSLLVSYFMSVTTLWLRIEYSQGPAFGAKNNLLELLGVFPWWALFIGLLSLLCLMIIIKRIGSFYKVRLIYLVPAIFLLFMIAGFLLSYSSLPRSFDGNRQDMHCRDDGSICRPSNMRYYRIMK